MSFSVGRFARRCRDHTENWQGDAVHLDGARGVLFRRESSSSAPDRVPGHRQAEEETGGELRGRPRSDFEEEQGPLQGLRHEFGSSFGSDFNTGNFGGKC